MNAELPRKRTKIIATLGPASRSPEQIRGLILAGMNVARLNFSHGSHEEHAEVIADVRRIAAELGTNIAILQDLPGPKVRTGDFSEGISALFLTAGNSLTLTTDPVLGTVERISVQYAGLARDVELGKLIYLADGALALRIVAKNDTEIRTIVEVGGELRARQGINYPDGSLGLATVTERDYEHLAFGIEQLVDWVAISFVRSALDIQSVREFMEQRGVIIPIIAKIEKHEALQHIDSIIQAADGIMVARGDLGIEIPLEQVPLWQKELITRANRCSKPVITATQMLESMISSPRPTRAEAADVANAILDGTDAVMLSGETARGAYPIQAVHTMTTIAQNVEGKYPHEYLGLRRIVEARMSASTAIADAAARIAGQLDMEIIVTGTTSGNTARHISSFRPHARVIALTPIERVARCLALVWGVEAVVVSSYRYIETLIETAEEYVVRAGLAKAGDLMVITSGMPVGEGRTNLIKVHRLAHQVAKSGDSSSLVEKIRSGEGHSGRPY